MHTRQRIRRRVVHKQNPGNARALFELIMPAVFPEERTLGGRFSWPWRGSRAAHAINEKSFLRSTWINCYSIVRTLAVSHPRQRRRRPRPMRRKSFPTWELINRSTFHKSAQALSSLEKDARSREIVLRPKANLSHVPEMIISSLCCRCRAWIAFNPFTLARKAWLSVESAELLWKVDACAGKKVKFLGAVLAIPFVLEQIG